MGCVLPFIPNSIPFRIEIYVLKKSCDTILSGIMRFIVIPFYIAEGEIFMKKSIRVLLGFALVFALVAVGTTGYFYLLKDKSNEPLSFESGGVIFDSGNYVASVNGVSVITDDTGVRIFNEADQTQKVIFDKAAKNVFFDGKTAYFVESEVEDTTVELYGFDGEAISADDHDPWLRAKIHSYNTETDKVTEIVTTNNNAFTKIVYVDDSAVYYTDWSEDKVGLTIIEEVTCPLYKYDFEKQTSTLVIDKIYPFTCEAEAGRLFYQAEGCINGDDGYHNIYTFDFKSGESNKISKDEAQFLKLEGEKVYYIERKWSAEVSDKIEYKLMSNDLSGQKAEIVAEFDFLPDETRVFATYVNENILAFTGRFDGMYIYNIKDGTFKHNDGGAAEYEVISNGTSAVLQKNYYSAEEEFIKTELYRYDDATEQELIEESDEDFYATKITTNGVYAHYWEGLDYCGVKFIPLENL